MILNEFYVQILKAVMDTAVEAPQKHRRPLVVQHLAILTQIVVVVVLHTHQIITGSYGLLLRNRIFNLLF
jgi:hypothetical protein